MYNTYLLGTAIKITVISNIASATSTTITIEDQCNIEKVTAATMTKEADYVYSYIWQSTDDDDEGTYLLSISLTSGAYTAKAQKTIEMRDPDLWNNVRS